MIDYKGGKVVWDNSYNWERSNYDYEQDILQLQYGENCVIDVGNYGDAHGEGRHFTIVVLDYTNFSEEEDNPSAWNHPVALIPCQDKADMLEQLQRAIDIYPGMIK